MTNPTPNQPSSAVDELAALSFNAKAVLDAGLIIGEPVIKITDVERIITAQEQELSQLRNALCDYSKHRLLDNESRFCYWRDKIVPEMGEKLTAQEQRLDWTRQERDKYDLMSIKMCEERNALQAKIQQQKQRLSALEQQVTDRNILFDPANPNTDMSYYDALQYHAFCKSLWEIVKPDGMHTCVELVKQKIKQQEQRIAELEAQQIKLWECPACGFGFDACHEDEGGGYTCPSCKQDELEAQLADAVLAMDAAEAAGRPEHESLQDSIEYFTAQVQAEREQALEERQLAKEVLPDLRTLILELRDRLGEKWMDGSVDNDKELATRRWVLGTAEKALRSLAQKGGEE